MLTLVQFLRLGLNSRVMILFNFLYRWNPPVEWYKRISRHILGSIIFYFGKLLGCTQHFAWVWGFLSYCHLHCYTAAWLLLTDIFPFLFSSHRGSKLGRDALDRFSTAGPLVTITRLDIIYRTSHSHGNASIQLFNLYTESLR